MFTAGCQSFGGCSNPDAYAGAENLPRLKIPVGLDGPDTSQSLQIPPEPVALPVAGDSCLEEPPEMREPGSNSLPLRADPGGFEDSRRNQEESGRRGRRVGPRS